MLKIKVLSKVVSVCMCIVLLISSVYISPSKVSSAKAGSPAAVYAAVESAYGSKFPIGASNLIVVDRTNIFGGYSTVLGVSAKYFSSYKAGRKGNSKEEYICFICKATSSATVSTIKSAMKKFISSEKKSAENYQNAKGKKLLSNAKIGSKGRYVYMFVLDTSNNKKAIKAFKKALT